MVHVFDMTRDRMKCALIGMAVLLLGACDAAPQPLPSDPAMDIEVRRTIAAGMKVQAAAMEAGAFAPYVLADKRAAPVRFDGKQVLCARLGDPDKVRQFGGRDRVMIVDLVEFADSPMQGPWFEYLWKRSGC